jgi:hypothetical protein
MILTQRFCNFKKKFTRNLLVFAVCGKGLVVSSAEVVVDGGEVNFPVPRQVLLSNL